MKLHPKCWSFKYKRLKDGRGLVTVYMPKIDYLELKRYGDPRTLLVYAIKKAVEEYTQPRITQWMEG